MARAQSPDDGGLLTITVLPGGTGVRLAGDVDMTSHDRLRHALASLPADSATVHLYLADLRFIDVGGARELLGLAGPHPSRRLILHDPPRTLRRLISLLWPDAGVEIRDSPGQPGPAGPFPPEITTHRPGPS